MCRPLCQLLEISADALVRAGKITALRPLPKPNDGPQSWRQFCLVSYDGGEHLTIGTANAELAVITRVPVRQRGDAFTARVTASRLLHSLKDQTIRGGAWRLGVVGGVLRLQRKQLVLNLRNLGLDRPFPFPLAPAGAEQPTDVDHLLLAGATEHVVSRMSGASGATLLGPDGNCTLLGDGWSMWTDEGIFWRALGPQLPFDVSLGKAGVVRLAKWIPLVLPQVKSPVRPPHKPNGRDDELLAVAPPPAPRVAGLDLIATEHLGKPFYRFRDASGLSDVWLAEHPRAFRRAFLEKRIDGPVTVAAEVDGRQLSRGLQWLSHCDRMLVVRFPAPGAIDPMLKIESTAVGFAKAFEKWPAELCMAGDPGPHSSAVGVASMPLARAAKQFEAGRVRVSFYPHSRSLSLCTPEGDAARANRSSLQALVHTRVAPVGADAREPAAEREMAGDTDQPV